MIQLALDDDGLAIIDITNPTARLVVVVFPFEPGSFGIASSFMEKVELHKHKHLFKLEYKVKTYLLNGILQIFNLIKKISTLDLLTELEQ